MPESTNGNKTLMWVLILLLTVAGQYIITLWVTNYGGNANVVSYVSFAGTIVSIILALLAIIYAYYQSFAQKRDSSTIAAQIEVMRSVVEETRSSARILEDGLEKIRDVGLKLDRSIAVGEESYQLTGQVLAQLERAKTATQEQAPSVTAPTAPHPSTVSLLTKSLSNLQICVYYCVIMAADRRWTPRKAANTIIIPSVSSKTANDNLAQWVDGVFTGHYMVLEDLGLITRAGNVLNTVHESLRSAIESAFNGLPMTEAEALLDRSVILDALAKADAS